MISPTAGNLVRMQFISITILSFFLSSCAYGQWRNNQRSHSLSQLPVNSTMRLCKDFDDIDRLKGFLKPLLVERVVDTPGHRNVGDYLQMTMDAMGWNTEWDEFSDKTPFGLKNFRSLIATYDPNAPRRLVMACHYDSKILPGQTFIGATDSAVPCAMMIDIAKTLTPYLYGRVAQNIGLQLVFLDGEEAFVNWSEHDSTYGARHLAAKWEKKWYPSSSSASNFELSREIDRIDVFMLLDLLGAANPHIQNVIGHGANSLFAELPNIEVELKQMGCLSRNIRNVFNPHLTGSAVEDDHIPFMNRGVPILHLISTPFPRVWHTRFDNESALDYPTISYLTSMLRVFVAKYLGIAPL